jgi:hypothetical protein
MLAEYKKKREADKKKENLKTLGRKEATANSRDGKTAFFTAESLGVKVTVLADTGYEYSAIPRSFFEDARKRGFPLKAEVLPEPIMLKMGIRGRRRQTEVQCDGDAHVCCEFHHSVETSVHAWSTTDHCRRRNGSSIDWKTSCRRDEFRCESLSGLCTGQNFHLHDFSHISGEAFGDEKAAFWRPVKLVLKLADIPE